MNRGRYKFIVDTIAGIGAIGQVAMSGAYIIWANPSSSGMILLATMAVIAIGAAIGVWTANIPMALYGTIVLYLMGFGQSAPTGIYILIFASFLAIASYLEWRKAHKQPPE